MARGDTLIKLLGILSETAISSFDFFDALVSAGYGASSGKINRELSKIERKRNRRKEEMELKQKYYNLVYKLKEDGLIDEKVKSKKRFFKITILGKEKLRALRVASAKRMPTPGSYEIGISSRFTIVIFDVPEREKRKREWLRSVLKNLGLSMVQKSVWIGKVKIPHVFLDDLDKYKMIDFVEIFEINKTGSLKRLA